MIHEIRIGSLGDTDPYGLEVLGDIRRLNLGSVDRVKTIKVYRIEGIEEEDVRTFAHQLVDIGQRFVLNAEWQGGAQKVVMVGYKPGVMNPEAGSIIKMACDSGFPNLSAADSLVEYHFYGAFGDADITNITTRLLVNKTVQQIEEEKPETLVINGTAAQTVVVPIQNLSDEELDGLSTRRQFFLNRAEMSVIRGEYRRLGRDPFDMELETLAQTWSEHCGHKTFRAKLIVNGKGKDPLIDRLRKTAARFSKGVISSFEDNSGVIEFYDGLGLCGKVETHNSPSAIEPYGGAATGSGGVFRDIIGTGQGAKVIASTDMFCFAPLNLPIESLPPGCLHPDYLFRRVIAGVRDYGNRMGIPTCNGSVHFHPDFRAKPSVIVGAYGIIPIARARKGKPQKGDLVVVIGGRTGRDGIHGATFSSGEMTDKTIVVNSAAVQIGHAIEEKRTADAMLVLRDGGYISANTDCGAGGLASAIGEMGKDSGVHVYLEKVPLKYTGLAPWEIWLSESQERMVIAIDAYTQVAVLDICKLFNVEATVIGHFTDDHRLTVTFNGATVCDLSMEFLHDGLPQRVMTADWTRPVFYEPEIGPCTNDGLMSVWHSVLSHGNVCSKESIVRRYDHGVQGSSALTPFSGVHNDGPNDAVALTPVLGKPYGVVISHGLNPVLNRIDPYWGSISAGVEALSNFVAAGGDVRQGEVGLIDNFIWPFPDEESLGALDMAIDACCKLMTTFGIPFVSGKDSLSGTYRGGGNVIRIPPVLCISAFGRIPDVTKTVSADFKRNQSRIVLVGNPDVEAMGGSVYYDTLGYVGSRVPYPDLFNLPRIFEALHHWIVNGKVLAVHDISEGGIAAALAEMCFGGDVGAQVNLNAISLEDPRKIFFNETPGCFLVEVPFGTSIERDLPGLVREIGFVSSDKYIKVSGGGCSTRVHLNLLKDVWQKPMKGVFDHATT